MASKESQAVSNWYRTSQETMADHPEWSPEQFAAFHEGWKVLTTPPGAVDYVEVDAGGATAMWAVPEGCREDRVLLCFHGGGFVSGSIYTHRKLCAHLAKAAGARALLVEYPLMPEGPYPIPIDVALSAYRWLLDQGLQADHIAFVGDSAGGGISVGAQLHARRDGLPLPACTLLISPWVDWEVAGESMQSNDGKDHLFNQSWVKQMADAYMAGTDSRDPDANALVADLGGLGPICIQVGDQELLLDDSRQLAEHAEQAGVEVRLDVFAEMQHSFQMMAGRAPEADDAIEKLGKWAQAKLGIGETEAVGTSSG
jgi:monoterpene epsilon-lactone hydrolase